MLVQVLQDSASLRAIKPLRNHLWGTQDRKQPRTFHPCCISLIAIRSSRQLPELRTENQAGSSPSPQLWQALGLLCWSPDSCSSLPRYILNLRKANQHTSVPAKTIFRAPEACVVPFPQRFPPRSSHPPPTPPTRTRRGHALRTALSAPARWHSTAGLHIPSCLTRPSPGSGDPGTPGAEAAGTAISPRGSRWHGTAQHGPARRRPRSLPGPARPGAACWQAARPTDGAAPAAPFPPPAPLGPLGTFSRKLLELVVFLQEPQVHRLLFLRHARPRCPPTLTGWRHSAARTAPAPQRRPPAPQHRLSAPPAPPSQRSSTSGTCETAPRCPPPCLGGTAEGSAGQDSKTAPAVLIPAPSRTERASSLYYFTLGFY